MTGLATPIRRAGQSASLLVLLHGLASSGSSWSAFAEQLDPGLGCVAVDLPGHGASPATAPYSYGQFALETARAVARAAAGRRVTVIGHSLGGAVGLMLGSGLFGLDVERVVTIGTKISWTADELARAKAVAGRPAKVFPTREDALAFWWRLAGTGTAHPDLDDVVRPAGGGWRLCYDQATAALTRAPIAELVRLATADVLTVRGETDPLVSAEDAAALGTPLRTIPGTAHSPHLESPAALVAALGLAPGTADHENRPKGSEP